MVKSTQESVVPVHDLSLLTGDRMAIFYGTFMAAFEALCGGAHGWISGILNVVPIAAKEMYHACVLEGDTKKGFSIWKKILSIVHLYTNHQIGSVSDLAIYRAMLKLWGLNGGYSRNPFFPLDTEQEQTLRRELEGSGWLDSGKNVAGIP
jgi:4-hydroxy-tetrahydrodipicolinate synthase